jgi:adenylylsulfate kinase
VKAAIVWFTGLPRAGKSTLAARVREALRARGDPCVVLDGDAVRAALVPTPGYDLAGRDAFYATLGRLAALIAAQGMTVLVPATAHRRQYRNDAGARAPAFVEVFVEATAQERAGRDEAGLYVTQATRERLPGVGVAYEAPERPDVVAHGGHDEAAVAAIVERLSNGGPS